MNFYGQWNPPVDQVLYENYFKDFKGGTYLECGAGDWGESCYFFEKELEWVGYNLEASKHTFQRLSRNRPHSNNINIALSSHSGSAKFTDVISAPYGGYNNGSLSHTLALKSILDGYECIYDEYNISTLSYKDFSTLYLSELDLMVLDVEGHELQVLKTFEYAKILPRVLCVEYPVSGFQNIYNILVTDKLNYRFDFVSYNNAFYSKGFDKNNGWFGETEKISDTSL